MHERSRSDGCSAVRGGSRVAVPCGERDRDGPLGDAWQAACEPAFGAWSARVDAFRASEEGMRAAEQQQRRAAAFEQLVTKFEAESATTCESCGGQGALSCSPESRRWDAVRCDECRDVGWTRVAGGAT